jgi:putative oxygen-independent coproporphyrinogen III oxidase
VSTPFGVYVHIPFCVHRCGYCAFATWSDRHHLESEYLDALEHDIRRSVVNGMPPASSIFVGGGTPSLVSPERLSAVIASIPCQAGAEITVECNPDDVNVDLLSEFQSAGVNRVSLGVQSTIPHVLASLDRTHDVEHVQTAVECIRSVGLPSFNLDLIYGTSGETVDEWQSCLAELLDYNPPHISAYALTVEPGTPLADQHERHPDDDDQADKYVVADEMLSAAGLANYEVSNWAMPGHECRHNLLYWRQQNYRGFGCAAHSHEDGRRWWNIRTPDRYISSVRDGGNVEAASEVLDQETREFERLELRLRLREGVPRQSLDGEALTGLVELIDDHWVLTRDGRLMANEISTRLIVSPTVARDD